MPKMNKTAFVFPTLAMVYLSAFTFAWPNKLPINRHEVTFTMEDALPAEKLFLEKTWGCKMWRLDVKFRRGSKRQRKTIFVEAEFPDAIACEPVILVERDSQWIALPLGRKSGKREDLSGYHWVYVGQDIKNAITCALLEYGHGDPGPIALVVSTDSGNTWELRSVLEKITYVAHFHDFVMGKSGNGRLTIALSDWDMTFGVEGGLYHYRTADGGYTWSGPDHEPHNLAKVPRDQSWLNRSVRSMEDLLALKW